MDVQIYPNPVEEQFSLYLNVDRASELRIEILNILGQHTYQANHELYDGAQTIYFGAGVVNEAMSESGIYFINLHIDGKFVGARKIVKQ